MHELGHCRKLHTTYPLPAFQESDAPVEVFSYVCLNKNEIHNGIKITYYAFTFFHILCM